ncbi:hypothetical protein COCNU_scaffold000903G000010 [Cocos nucifera]|nr:hypothetical protein [Cocos nucifera]
MLTKGLYTKKKKGKVQNDSLKRAKVDVSSSEVPTSTVTAFEVIVGAKTVLTTKSPTNVDPLPLGVLIKPLIKNLWKKVHLLRKKLKKMEDDLQAS